MRRSAKTVGVVSESGVEHLDQAALLGDEDAPVRGEAHDGRVGESAEDDGLLEARRHRGRCALSYRRRGAAGADEREPCDDNDNP